MDVSSELLFWKIAFSIALVLTGAFSLICCCLLGGSYYKYEAEKNAHNFAQVLNHQAKLWKQERERWGKEHELRLEEQRHKNTAWEHNSALREDMDDVMEENRVLRIQKDELNHRNEQLTQENERLRMENEGLKVRMAQVRRPEFEPELEPGPEPKSVVELEPERPYSKVRFPSTLLNSGLPPGSNLSLEEPVQQDLDSPQSHASFPSAWFGSEPSTPTRTELPPSPDDEQGLRIGTVVRGMVTMGGLLSGPKQRNTWAADSASPGPSHEEDDKWKPVSPGQRCTSVS